MSKSLALEVHKNLLQAVALIRPLITHIELCGSPGEEFNQLESMTELVENNWDFVSYLFSVVHDSGPVLVFGDYYASNHSAALKICRFVLDQVDEAYSAHERSGLPLLDDDGFPEWSQSVSMSVKNQMRGRDASELLAWLEQEFHLMRAAETALKLDDGYSKVMKKRQVADLLCISTDTLADWIKARKIRTKDVTYRTLRVHLEDLPEK